MRFDQMEDPELVRAARIAVRDVFKTQAGERAVIVTNPSREVSDIARALYGAFVEAQARPVLVYQEEKSQLDFTEEAVIGALQTAPDIYVSMSAQKIGKDPLAQKKPYRIRGKTFVSISDFLLNGKKKTRGFWSPGITRELFIATVPVDYRLLRRRAKALKTLLDQAAAVHITSPGGTDLRFSLEGRKAFLDDGDYSKKGRGGNLPAGEAFISPAKGTTEGVVVFDGSISTFDGSRLVDSPVEVRFEKGYITSITSKGPGKEAAEALAKTISLGEENALKWEAEGKLAPGEGGSYRKNARHLGELGIGLNPAAGITGNMLVDEKAFRTIHLAIGSNYDNDAQALIHLDCLVKDPTLVLSLAGENRVVLERGELKL